MSPTHPPICVLSIRLYVSYPSACMCPIHPPVCVLSIRLYVLVHPPVCVLVICKKVRSELTPPPKAHRTPSNTECSTLGRVQAQPDHNTVLHRAAVVRIPHRAVPQARAPKAALRAAADHGQLVASPVKRKSTLHPLPKCALNKSYLLFLGVAA